MVWFESNAGRFETPSQWEESSENRVPSESFWKKAERCVWTVEVGDVTSAESDSLPKEVLWLVREFESWQATREVSAWWRNEDRATNGVDVEFEDDNVMIDWGISEDDHCYDCRVYVGDETFESVPILDVPALVEKCMLGELETRYSWWSGASVTVTVQDRKYSSEPYKRPKQL